MSKKKNNEPIIEEGNAEPLRNYEEVEDNG